ncbi:hypothetical protein ACJIZ3_001248 [Penstemon smallii]|uniref:16S rRNA (uracil(1498)-N(3))-methyltransferase n=1 Tax=Penstemon smallii TaxID=265156 RepID=A0ABD3U3G4_9LAMI
MASDLHDFFQDFQESIFKEIWGVCKCVLFCTTSLTSSVFLIDDSEIGHFPEMANNPHFTGMQPLQPHMIVNAGPPPNPLPPPMSMQFRPGVPPPPPQPFIPVPPQQFQHMGMPPHPPPLQYPQAAPPPPQPPRPPQGPPLPPPPVMSVSFMPNFGGPRIPPPSYPLPLSSIGQQQSSVGPTTNIPHFTAGGQPWFPNGNQTMQAIMPQQQPIEQNGGGQPWFPTVNQSINTVTPLQQTSGPNDVAQQWVSIRSENVQSNLPSQKTTEEQSVSNFSEEKSKSDFIKQASLDWGVYTTRAGKKYYYNRRTKVSDWEKPLELMTPAERADASTDWREFTSPEGRKCLARAKENMSLCEGTPTIKDIGSNAVATVSVSGQASTPNDSLTPGSSSVQDEVANVKEDATGLPSPLETTTPIDIITASAMATPKRTSDITLSKEAEPSSSIGTSNLQLQVINKSAGISESGGSNAPEEKKVVYESKEDAKNAFKALLETANVGSGWNWDQAMRVIINDPRYAALRTLGERKQVFNEFVGKKKKQEVEERRARQKNAREDFKKIKAVSMFENDERFHALERYKDREDLFADHIEEVMKKERAKALEEHKRNKMEYLELLKSCDFIKASSQWRKVQQRLEADERCSRLDKIERLEIFQEYTRDLEKEEEELRKLRMDELRKAERKNRDEFRKLMEEHVSSGTINAKTPWRDYCTKVKDAPAYLAVFSNTSGSTAKDLFEDVIEDLEKQYVEDKERIEDVLKFEKRAFDELMEKTKEKEGKETKRRKRQTEELYEFLFSSKEITASSKWEDSKLLVEERFAGDEIYFQEIFDKVINDLKEKGKEKERKRRDEKSKKERKDKEKKEKEKEKEKERKHNKSRKGKGRRKRNESDSDGSGSYSLEENRRSRDRGRNRRRRSDDSSGDSKKSKVSELYSQKPIKLYPNLPPMGRSPDFNLHNMLTLCIFCLFGKKKKNKRNTLKKERERENSGEMGKEKNYWLLKTEPGEWSWDDQSANADISKWDGVKNKQAQKYMKSMRVGDLCFFYHSGTKSRRVVGVVEVVREWYEDAVDVKAVGEMKTAVGLGEMKRELKGVDFALFRQPRLSVVPVEKGVWDKFKLVKLLNAFYRREGRKKKRRGLLQNPPQRREEEKRREVTPEEDCGVQLNRSSLRAAFSSTSDYSNQSRGGLPRFFSETLPPSKGGLVRLEGDEFWHMTKVLRLGINDKYGLTSSFISIFLSCLFHYPDKYEVELFNGKGGLVEGRIEKTDRSGVEFEALEDPRLVSAQTTQWHVFAPLGTLKGGRADWLVEKCTVNSSVVSDATFSISVLSTYASQELGASSVTPLLTERSPSISENRADRLQRVILAAAKQCQRLHEMILKPPIVVGELLPVVAQSRLSFVAVAEAAPILSTLSFLKKEPAGVMIIGPEGDFTKKELDSLMKAGAIAVGLGPHRLRVETATVAILSTLMFWSDSQEIVIVTFYHIVYMHPLISGFDDLLSLACPLIYYSFVTFLLGNSCTPLVCLEVKRNISYDEKVTDLS